MFSILTSLSISTPLELRGWDTPFHNVSVKSTGVCESMINLESNWDETVWSQDEAGPVGESGKSGQIKPRTERPASVLLTRWQVCICVYISDASTPCLGLLTQSSMNTDRGHKRSGELINSFISQWNAKCRRQQKEKDKGSGCWVGLGYYMSHSAPIQWAECASLQERLPSPNALGEVRPWTACLIQEPVLQAFLEGKSSSYWWETVSE